jgi:hypothetical protein
VLLIAVLAAAAVSAQDVPSEAVMYKNRILQVASGQDPAPILRVESAQYVLPRSQAELAERAQACLAGVPGITPQADGLEAEVQTSFRAVVQSNFRASFTNYVLRSRLRLDVSEGAFRLSESELMLGEDDGSGKASNAIPLTRSGKVWEKALDQLLQTEDKVVDCLFR